MEAFDLNITIHADNQKEVNEIGKALTTIYKHVSTEDLKVIADWIEKDPTVIMKVKNLANKPFIKKLF